MAIIDEGLLTELAGNRTLNTIFERTYMRNHNGVNPIAVAVTLERQRSEQAHLPLICVLSLLLLVAIGLQMWVLLHWLDSERPLHHLSQASCIAVTAGAFVGTVILLIRIFRRSPDRPERMDVLTSLLADLNEMYCWLQPNEYMRTRSDAIEFLTAPRGTLTVRGKDVLRVLAEAVERHRPNVSVMNSNSVRHLSELGYAAERRYGTGMRLGMVAEGALARAYAVAEAAAVAATVAAPGDEIVTVASLATPEEFGRGEGGIRDSSE